MWRALFFAIGIVLIILGVECMMVGRFTISNDAYLSRTMTNLMASINNPPANIAAQQTAQPAPLAQTNQYGGYGGNPMAPSRFGGTRTSRSTFANDQFYAQNSNRTSLLSGRQSSATAPNNPYSLTGYSRPAIQPAAISNTGTVSVIHTKDWMPWSLVAAGALIVIYTNTFGQRAGSSD